MNPPWFGWETWIPPSVGSAFLRFQQPDDAALALQLAFRRLGIGRIAEYRFEHGDGVLVTPQLVQRLGPAESETRAGRVPGQSLARRLDGALVPVGVVVGVGHVAVHAPVVLGIGPDDLAEEIHGSV